MRKLFFTLLFIAPAFFTTRAQLLLQLSGDSLIPYNYVGGDEFNGTGLNNAEWINGMGWTRVLMSQEVAFSPNRVKFSDGLLNLESDLEDSTYILTPWEIDSNMIRKEKLVLRNNEYKTKYVSASIISKKKYHYGLYELKFKVEEGKGIWPAFWFFGGYKNEEIDAFELKCEKNNTLHLDTHCPWGCDHGYKNKIGLNSSWGGWMPVSGYLHDGFNTLMLHWKPKELIWYINGYPLAYFRGSFPNPMNLYINSNVAATGRAFGPGPDQSNTWPNKFLVDYIRIWQPLPVTQPITLIPNDVPGKSLKFPLQQLKPLRKRGLLYWKNKLNPLDGMIYLHLSTARKLTIITSGELTEAAYTVELKFNSKTVVIPKNNPYTEIILDKNESTAEVIIKTSKKEIKKQILLN